MPTISNNAITSAKIADGEIAIADLANNSINSSKIIDGAIETSDLAANAVSFAKMQTVTANKLLGSGASGTAVSEISLGAGLIFTGSSLSTIPTGILPVANGGTNSSTTLNNNRIMVSSAGSIKEASALTDGQLLIGVTGGAPVAANLTAGNGITITNTAGAITIASTPTIQQASGTSTLTTLSKTDVALSTPLEITPGEGDYLIFFTGVVSNNTGGIGTIMSIYVDGVKIAASEIQATSGKNNDKNTIASNAYVTGVTAGQTIEMRWRAENQTASITNRTLIIQRVK